jgi:hypothetical protein
MKVQCGICEYSGDLASAPLSLCSDRADAIRRLIWIRDREQQAAEAPLAMSQGAAATSEKAAAPHRR